MRFSLTIQYIFRQNSDHHRALSDQDFSFSLSCHLRTDDLCVLVNTFLLLHEKMDVTTQDDGLERAIASKFAKISI